MTIQVYLNTDIGAPQLTGQVGALLGVLDVLVNGYPSAGSAAVSSITSSGGVATITYASAHGFPAGAQVQVAGCDQAAYNGKQSITIVDATHVTFAVAGSPASPATGASITAVRAGLGWAKPYTGTNKAVYRAAVGNQRYLRILDDGSATSGARQAFGIGYESMTAVDTGTNAFPNTGAVNSTNGSYWSKSVSLDGTARRWVLIAEDQFFYLFTEVNNSFAGRFIMAYFGDFPSLLPGDAYNTVIPNCTLALGATSNPSQIDNTGIYGDYTTLSPQNCTAFTAISPRNISGTFGSIGHVLMPDLMNMRGGSGLTCTLGFHNTPLAFPDPVTGGLQASTCRLAATSPGNHVRGYMPGLYMPQHNQPLQFLDQATNLAGFTGRTLLAITLPGSFTNGNSIGLGGNSTGIGQCLVDITGPWR